MALIASLAALASAGVFGLLCAGLGIHICRSLRLEIENTLELLLCSAALGVICYQTLLAILEFVMPTRWAVGAALAILILFGAWGFRQAIRFIGALTRSVLAGSRAEHLLAAIVAALLLFQGFAATAPVTGSDALRYHFMAPLYLLQQGYHADFSQVHSFFAGQCHLLILTGLVLGSEKFSMVLLFLGAVLAAAGAACLVRRWASRELAWLCALTFLATPVVFWQSSTSGAPDLWMAFFAVVAVLIIARVRSDHRLAFVLAAGALSGALAGAKYTGCIFAAMLLAAFFWEMRSLRRVALFCLSALATGIWPYARNFRWTHDPVFPFALRWLAPERINATTLASLIGDTGAGGHAALSQILLFPFFAGADVTNIGLWHFFGPLQLAFAPLIFLAARNTSLWRVATIFSIGSGVLVAISSGMLRFLMPAFPVVLAASFAGIFFLWSRPWWLARAVVGVTIAAWLSACFAGVLYYGAPAALAGAGLRTREQYLQQRAPDYGKTQFINEQLEPLASEGKVLVFFQHRYYLRVPFVSGNPDDNWNIDPRRYASPDAWMALFREQNVRWVVRNPEYPASIADPLTQLENSGRLVPMASGKVTDFSGMRIQGLRTTTPITILRVTK